MKLKKTSCFNIESTSIKYFINLKGFKLGVRFHNIFCFEAENVLVHFKMARKSKSLLLESIADHVSKFC